MTDAPILPAMLARLAGGPRRPCLTWYGEGERVELSGHVLDNWVTKTANLLVEEFAAQPGTRVLLDLPPHWRTVVWAAAAWRVGACVRLGSPASGPGAGGAGRGVPARAADLVVTSRPGEVSGAPVVAVALPALARAFDGPLPAGAIDAAAAVMTYGDVLTWMPEHDALAPAVEADGEVVPHAVLAGWAERAVARTGVDPTGRVLLRDLGGAPGTPGATDAGPATGRVLALTLGVLAAGGSVLLDGAGTADDALVRSELVTATVSLTD